MQTDTILDGKYELHWNYAYGPYHKQMLLLGKKGLEIPSPALIGAMRASTSTDHNFWYTCRTSMPYIGRPKTGDYVFIRGPLGLTLCKIYASAMVAAHKKHKEFVFPDQDVRFIDSLIKEALEEKMPSAFEVAAEGQVIEANDFGKNNLAPKIFSDATLGIVAGRYGISLRDRTSAVPCNVTFGLRPKDYVQAQKGEYMGIVSISGYPTSFVDCYNEDTSQDGIAAFGVRLEKDLRKSPTPEEPEK